MTLPTGKIKNDQIAQGCARSVENLGSDFLERMQDREQLFAWLQNRLDPVEKMSPLRNATRRTACDAVLRSGIAKIVIGSANRCGLDT